MGYFFLPPFQKEQKALLSVGNPLEPNCSSKGNFDIRGLFYPGLSCLIVNEGKQVQVKTFERQPHCHLEKTPNIFEMWANSKS